MRGTRLRPARKLTIVIFGNKKDFPREDYLKKNGWDYSLTICKCGNILYADKTYCKECKGKQWSTIECTCKIPMK